eukprot:m.56048 g.56048  ORF g.56048 m.56048 type:complete len:269 (-) comp11536_c1_seq1:182-988(-)
MAKPKDPLCARNHTAGTSQTSSTKTTVQPPKSTPTSVSKAMPTPLHTSPPTLVRGEKPVAELSGSGMPQSLRRSQSAPAGLHHSTPWCCSPSPFTPAMLLRAKAHSYGPHTRHTSQASQTNGNCVADISSRVSERGRWFLIVVNGTSQDPLQSVAWQTISNGILSGAFPGCNARFVFLQDAIAGWLERGHDKLAAHFRKVVATEMEFAFQHNTSSTSTQEVVTIGAIVLYCDVVDARVVGAQLIKHKTHPSSVLTYVVGRHPQIYEKM